MSMAFNTNLSGSAPGIPTSELCFPRQRFSFPSVVSYSQAARRHVTKRWLGSQKPAEPWARLWPHLIQERVESVHREKVQALSQTMMGRGSREERMEQAWQSLSLPFPLREKREEMERLSREWGRWEEQFSPTQDRNSFILSSKRHLFSIYSVSVMLLGTGKYQTVKSWSPFRGDHRLVGETDL